MYGREANGVGVWCPRSNEDKKYVMLNFFPQVVTDLLMPPPKEMPKYMVAIFPALFSNEIMELPEVGFIMILLVIFSSEVETAAEGATTTSTTTFTSIDSAITVASDRH